MVSWIELVVGIFIGIALSSLMPSIPENLKRIFENIGKDIQKKRNPEYLQHKQMTPSDPSRIKVGDIFPEEINRI